MRKRKYRVSLIAPPKAGVLRAGLSPYVVHEVEAESFRIEPGMGVVFLDGGRAKCFFAEVASVQPVVEKPAEGGAK